MRLKQAVTGPVKRYRQGENVKAWLSNMEFLINYYEYDNEAARMFIYNHIDCSTIKLSVSNIMKEHRGCSIPELMTALNIGLGAKRHAIVIAEERTMKRQNGKPVQPFGLRVSDVINQKVMSDPDGKMLMDTEL